MGNFRERKVLSIILILAVVAAIPLTVYISQKQQDIRQRAAETTGADLSSQKSQVYSVLNFPADHGSHPSFKAEWWYLNLLTRTNKTDGTDQRDLAYVLSFSRILSSNNLLSSRYDNTSKSFKESTEQADSLVVQLLDSSRLSVQFNKGSVLTTLEELATGSDRKKVYHLTGNTVNMGSFDLTLKERTVVSSGFNTPLLWGGTTGNCQGKISVFAQDDTYYYSVPDLDITGSITDLDGTRRNVLIGKAWIDHQWFNNSPSSDWQGHYWTNFHFTNSSDLYESGPHQAFGFVTQIYNDGPKFTYWVKRNADGTNECGTDGTVAVKSYGSTNYPNSWTFNNGPLDAEGSSFSDNQIFQLPIGPKFIEAASYYSGNLNGTPFTGLGFFETHLIRPSVTSSPTPTSSPIPTPTPQPVQNITIAQGWNLIGITFDKGTNYKASDFAQELNSSLGNSDVMHVIGWKGGRYIVYAVGSDANDFPIVPGQGYWIRSSSSGNATISGSAQASISSLSILQGWSLISFPSLPSGITTAESLLQVMKTRGISARQILKREGGKWVTHSIDTNADNFNIVPGEGYFIRNFGTTKTFNLP